MYIPPEEKDWWQEGGCSEGAAAAPRRSWDSPASQGWLGLMGHEVSLWTKYMPVRRASVHCIYVYVHVYTMLGWKLWFWKGFNASNNSLYWSDAYSNDQTIFNGWMLSNQCWVFEDVQTCLYHVYTNMYIPVYVHTLYICVCTCLYDVRMEIVVLEGI